MFQGIQDDQAQQFLEEIGAAMAAEVKGKTGGPWSRKSMVNLWFFQGTEMTLILDRPELHGEWGSGESHPGVEPPKETHGQRTGGVH